MLTVLCFRPERRFYLLCVCLAVTSPSPIPLLACFTLHSPLCPSCIPGLAFWLTFPASCYSSKTSRSLSFLRSLLFHTWVLCQGPAVSHVWRVQHWDPRYQMLLPCGWESPNQEQIPSPACITHSSGPGWEGICGRATGSPHCISASSSQGMDIAAGDRDQYLFVGKVMMVELIPSGKREAPWSLSREDRGNAAVGWLMAR